MEGQINLLDITDVVLQNHLFPLLRRNDLLRLRRVSKKAKQLAEEHLGMHHVDNRNEVEITDHPGSDRNLTAFLKMGIACGRIYLMNNSAQFFEDAEISSFLEKYGDKITHLRVRNFYALASQPEMSFYEALTSLKHLTLENVDATPFRCNVKKLGNGNKRGPRQPCPVTQTLKQLKTLKFGHVKAAKKDDTGYWIDIIQSCRENLETIGHPLNDYVEPPITNNPLGFIPAGVQNFAGFAGTTGVFREIGVDVLDWRHKEHGNRPNLQFYDFENFRDVQTNPGSAMDFIIFSQSCHQHGVKLLNVDADVFSVLGPMYLSGLDGAAENLVSVRNLSQQLFKWEFPRLERMVIITSKSAFYPVWMYPGARVRKPDLPSLKILDITVDGTELAPLPTREGPMSADVEILYEFLFEKVVRRKMEELTIRFDGKASQKMNLPCPRAVDLKTSCPNLKKLTLQGWTGTNKALTQLWGGLKLLEELTLEDIAGLGNVAFVGLDKDNPIFLTMTNLKVLTLNGLELMPKVTDTLFSLVLRKAKLVKLFLGSKKPVKHISPTGIKSLLSGDFAKSIEKFPFSGWSLAGVSPQEFQELERQFRSYYMN